MIKSKGRKTCSVDQASAKIGIRQDFPLLKKYNIAYLDNAATTQKPSIVIDTLKSFYENSNANAHRGIYKLSEEATSRLYEARRTFAEFLKANPEEIIFVKSATEGINNIATSIERTLEITGEHNIVATQIEHHSNLLPWQQLAKRTGASLRIVRYDPKRNRLEKISEVVDESTIAVAFSGMSNVTGLIPDAKAIIREIRKKNMDTLIIIDATQLAAHKRINAQELGADFIVLSCHKIYGPTGTGVVYGKRQVLEKIEPFLYGGNMIGQVELYDSTWAELPDKFEAGTLDTPGIYASSIAAKYLAESFDNAMIVENKLKDYLLSGLRKIDRVRIIGHDTNGEYGPVVSFTIERMHPHDIATIADQHGVCIRAGHHCCEPLMRSLRVVATSRASIALYNTREDIDRLLESIRHAIRTLG